MTIQAKPIVKNKYWIVEDDGRKIATIQAAEDGVVLVQDNHRLKYPSIKVLGTAHNIRFVRGQKIQTAAVDCHCTQPQPKAKVITVQDFTQSVLITNGW
jgi:hypothetical protein